MSQAEIDMIMALAGQLATARARRALWRRGCGAPAETEEIIDRRVDRATRQLEDYLNNLKEKDNG